MNLQNGIPFSFGPLQTTVFGGPYRKFSPDRRLVGVKMAAEINMDCDVDIPTEDYSVPDHTDMVNGLCAALSFVAAGNDLYVGCMGGIGRTGLFLGCMTKVLMDFETSYPELVLVEKVAIRDPVAFVRKHYKGSAIETDEQRSYVRNFDTQEVLDHILLLLRPYQQEVSMPQSPAKEAPKTLGGAFLHLLSVLFGR